LAIKAAQAKAQALAHDTGRNIGKPLSIYEGWTWAGYRSWWGGQSATSQNVVSRPSGEPSEAVAGQIGVTASVNVVFALQ
jgi:uncharacterized protein YggE